MPSSPRTLLVRFTRDAVEDVDCARENFPHLEFDPTLQLLEQFKLELGGAKKLCGLWTMLHHVDTFGQTPDDGILYVWVLFKWRGTIGELCDELQRTNDFGMNGRWVIVDGLAKNGEIYSRSDIDAAISIAFAKPI